jgi:hypothetical protein
MKLLALFSAFLFSGLALTAALPQEPSGTIDTAVLTSSATSSAPATVSSNAYDTEVYSNTTVIKWKLTSETSSLEEDGLQFPITDWQVKCPV